MLLIVPVDLQKNLPIVKGIGLFPVQAKGIVDLKDRCDIAPEIRINQSRAN
jgi:hypothetical protein